MGSSDLDWQLDFERDLDLECDLNFERDLDLDDEDDRDLERDRPTDLECDLPLEGDLETDFWYLSVERDLEELLLELKQTSMLINQTAGVSPAAPLTVQLMHSIDNIEVFYPMNCFDNLYSYRVIE